MLTKKRIVPQLNEYPYQYQAFGLTICSSLELPELVPAKIREKIDIWIKKGDVPNALDNPEITGVRFQAKAGYFLLKVDNIARYLVQEGREVIIEPNPAAGDEEIRLFLFGTVFGALIHQRGLLPLHASAIKVENKCVLFCGSSGSGKSTLAKYFLEQGYTLLSDDICAVFLNELNLPMVYPGYPQLKLWKDILLKINKYPHNYKRVRPILDKFSVPAHKQFSSTPLLIKKIYLLGIHNKREIEFGELSGLMKFKALIEYTYRFRLAEAMKSQISHFQIASILGKVIPLTKLKRSPNLSQLNELTDLLEKDFLN